MYRMYSISVCVQAPLPDAVGNAARGGGAENSARDQTSNKDQQREPDGQNGGPEIDGFLPAAQGRALEEMLANFSPCRFNDRINNITPLNEPNVGPMDINNAKVDTRTEKLKRASSEQSPMDDALGVSKMYSISACVQAPLSDAYRDVVNRPFIATMPHCMMQLPGTMFMCKLNPCIAISLILRTLMPVML